MKRLVQNFKKLIILFQDNRKDWGYFRNWLVIIYYRLGGMKQIDGLKFQMVGFRQRKKLLSIVLGVKYDLVLEIWNGEVMDEVIGSRYQLILVGQYIFNFFD